MREIYPVAWRFRHTSSGDIWHVTNREPLDMPKHYDVQPLCRMDTVLGLLEEIERLRRGQRIPSILPPPELPDPPLPPRGKRVKSTATPELIRMKDAQKMLGIGHSTLYLWIKQGRLKSVKLSERSTAIRRDELQRFMDSLK